MALFAFLIGIAHATKVDGAYTILFQPTDSLVKIAFTKVPIACKIVHQTVGNESQGNGVAHLFLYFHQTVYRIIECRVTTGNDNGLVAVVNQHIYQAFYAACSLALHKVVIHTMLIECTLNTFALLARTVLGAI